MNTFLNYKIISFHNGIVTVGDIMLLLVVIFGSQFLIKLVVKIISARLNKKGQSTGQHLSIIKLVNYFLWVITIVFSCQILGINISFLIASSAALLVGFGLGMQAIFKDFVSGIIILFEGTIKVNDIIELEHQILKVKEITLRTSRVITRDENVIIIPNHKFIDENVINWSHNASPTRFTIEVGVDYSSDLKEVDKCLLLSVIGNENIIHDKPHEPFTRLKNFGDSAFEFQLFFWTYDLFRVESTKGKIRLAIAKIFKEKNIIIPFNQIVIHQS